jgi:acyl-CoA synthetase (NDP forming)/GNAT superfamily N-acetyltransferase
MAMPDMLSTDGHILNVRPVAPGDADGLRRLYRNIGERSRYLRFFSHGRIPLIEEVDRLTRPHGPEHYAVAALDREEIIGVASYERLDDPSKADFAVLVADQWQGRGTGTLMLEQLASYARTQGITELAGDVLQANGPMLRVAADLSAGCVPEFADGQTVVRIPTEYSETALAALDARERIAEQHSLRALLAPRSVAVVGAGRKAHGIGHEVLANITAHAFTGQVFAVNPHATEVAGVGCFPAVSAIPEPVDLVIVAVPPPAVAGVLEDAGIAGARAVVVLTAGFGENGHEGEAVQQELVRIARRHSMRLVGPNCLGILNSDPQIRLAATFAAELPVSGTGLAVAAQSGAVGIAVLDHASRAGLGVSTFVSLGNKADVSSNDLLSYWFSDPATHAVALYLESFGNPRKFARVARAVAQRKPVIVVKGGRSDGGQRAGASHTAAAASPDIAVDSLFAQAGVIRADGLGELIDTARILVGHPLPQGRRVALIGNAGGLNVLAADAAEANGLAVPQIGEIGNPLDLGAGATPAALGESIRAVAAGGQADMIVAIFGATRSNDPQAALAEIGQAADDHPDLPMAALLVGVTDPPAWLGKRRIPVYGLPEQVMRAFGHAARYGAWRSQSPGSQVRLPDVDPSRARSVLNTASSGWQPWPVTAELLGAYGIPVLPSTLAFSLDEAVAAATHMRYPVVLKAAGPDLVHKTESGAVRLNLTDATAVASAYQAIAAAVKHAQPAVLVQPMRTGGIEMTAGIVHDPLFGSLIMTGLGGIHTDLLADRCYQLLPVTDVDAATMWRRLRGAPLLTGYRGSSPGDTAALEDVLLRLGRLAEDVPQIAELDLNPLLVFPHGVMAVDVKLRLAPIGIEPDATQRALRS